jgi:hypothetical protein
MNLKLDVYNDELNLMAYKSSLEIAFIAYHLYIDRKMILRHKWIYPPNLKPSWKDKLKVKCV